jgi:hypothetical protein
MLDRKNNWIYMTPEEMFNLPEYGPDGLEKKKASLAERYYNNLERQPGSPLKGNIPTMDDAVFGSPNGTTTRTRNHETASRGDSNLPTGVREISESLRKQVGSLSSGGATTPTRSLSSSFFGSGDKGLSPAEIEAHQEYMRSFREEVLNSRPTVASAGPGLAAGVTAPIPGGGLPDLSPRRPDGYDARLGGVSPTYVPGAPADINSKVLNDWDPGYTPPKPPAPKPLPPPSFTVPRRQGI